MSRTSLLLPVFASVALVAATTAERANYGGVLAIESAATLSTFEPSRQPPAPADRVLHRQLLPLVFETLVAVDPDGGLEPSLATAWTSSDTGRWTFTLRAGVTLHDGTTLAADQVAAALRESLSPAQVAVDRNAIVIQPMGDRPDLLWELAEPTRAVTVPGADGRLLGTGPFRVDRIEPRRLRLSAHDEHWAGRPFVDAVEIEFGRSPMAQLTAVETGRADLVSARITDARRVAQEDLQLFGSRPLELVALLFETDRAAAADLSVRRTVSAAIDRTSMARVLLQEHGEAADALVPSWLTGYPASLVAPAGAPLSRGMVEKLPAARRTLVLRVAADDAVARTIADRIAVEARDAGFAMTVQAPAGLAPRADLRLIRVPLVPTTPARTMAALMESLGSRTLAAATREAPPVPADTVEAVARVERSLLERFVIVPVVHLPILAAASRRVATFTGPVLLPTGGWNLADVWLRPQPGGPR